MPTATFAIEGMSCAACVGRVERTLKAVPGVTGAQAATQRGVELPLAHVARLHRLHQRELSPVGNRDAAGCRGHDLRFLRRTC